MIKLVTQTLPNNCVSACLSMITERSIEEITQKFHDAYHAHTYCMHDYLAEKGIEFIKHYSGPCCTLNRGFIYMLSVPSLNYIGGMHELIVDYSKSIPEIFDPAPEHKKRYTRFGAPNSGDLCSWNIDAEIPVASLINWRANQN